MSGKLAASLSAEMSIYCKRSSPGRFFAALEIKMMLAVLIMKYDIRLPGEGKRPNDSWFGPVCTPSTSAKVLLKKRER